MSSPCLSCGACCAHFRVSFYWSEADPFVGGTVPAEMTVAVNQHYVAMRGTEHRPARCCALQGVVGEGVVCSIYAQRPQVCHEIMYTDYLGLREEKCDRARQAHGLPPLSPDHQPELDPPWPRSA